MLIYSPSIKSPLKKKTGSVLGERLQSARYARATNPLISRRPAEYAETRSNLSIPNLKIASARWAGPWMLPSCAENPRNIPSDMFIFNLWIFIIGRARSPDKNNPHLVASLCPLTMSSRQAVQEYICHIYGRQTWPGCPMGSGRTVPFSNFLLYLISCSSINRPTAEADALP